ncbi:MAG: DUF1464 family protein, partial [Candidatus Bathyarchaeota archaeon]
LFSALLAVKDQAERYNIGCSETSFILLEVGFAYTVAMAVDKGRIVDSIGGTTGGLGYLGMGGMDSELAYALSNALPNFSKQLLFSGGATSVADVDPSDVSPDEFVKLSKTDDRIGKAYDALIESALKDLAMLLTTLPQPSEIILSGRFMRVQTFLEDLKTKLQDFSQNFGWKIGVRTLGRRAENVKEGAEGAAVLANGIAGGKYSPLIEVMDLKRSSGTILDYICLEKDLVKKLRERYS